MSGKLSRRDFIKKSAIGIVAGSAVLNSIGTAAYTESRAARAVRAYGDDIIIKLSENRSLSKPGGSLRVSDEIMLIRKSETEFIAVNTICTHKGCDVELEGNKFVCPCHGSEYTIEGKVIEGPAKKDLTVYQTIYNPDNGTVTIKLNN